MAFLDDILGGGRWLDQLLGTGYGQNLDERAPGPFSSPASSQQPQANPQSIAEWLRANGLLGAGPQGTGPGLLRPNTNPNLQADEAQRGILGGAPAASPVAGPPLPTPDPRGSIPFDAIPGPVDDMSAASKKGPLPPQPLVGGAPQPPTPAEQDPGIFGRLQAGATNFTSGGNPIAGLLNAVQGLATGTRTDKTGIALAQQAQSAQLMYQHLVNVEGMEPAKAATLAKMMALNPKVQEEFFKPPTTVEGAAARKSITGVGGATKEALDFLQKKSAAEKAGSVQGEAQATAQVTLPATVAGAQEQIRLVNELLAHPGRNQIGWHDLAGKAPLIPGTKGYGAQVLLDQIKGGAFLEGFKSLKGSGAITEVEGTKATTAINRMERATSRVEFEKAAKDYIGIVKLGIDRAMNTAGAKPPYGFKGNQGGPPPGFRVIE